MENLSLRIDHLKHHDPCHKGVLHHWSIGLRAMLVGKPRWNEAMDDRDVSSLRSMLDHGLVFSSLPASSASNFVAKIIRMSISYRKALSSWPAASVSGILDWWSRDSDLVLRQGRQVVNGD